MASRLNNYLTPSTDQELFLQTRSVHTQINQSKIFFKNHGGNYKNSEQPIASTQFRIRSGQGSRDALFAMEFLLQRCLENNVTIYIWFADLEKASDGVKHEKLLSIPNSPSIDHKDIPILANIYWNLLASVRELYFNSYPLFNTRTEVITITNHCVL